MIRAIPKWLAKQWQSVRDNALMVLLAIMGIFGISALGEFAKEGFKFSGDVFNHLNLQNFFVDVLLVLILLKIFRIDRRIAQMDQKAEFFRSDEEHTKFIESNWPDANVRRGMLAVEADPDEHNWAVANGRFPQLEGCIWLAHEKHITEEEAIKGGRYKFSRDFTLPCNLSALKAAILQLIVDDECELSINGYQYSKVRGYLDRIHSFDLLPHLNEGRNALEFLVHNDSFEKFNNPQVNPDFFYSKEKWRKNPYGIKYLVTIRYLQ